MALDVTQIVEPIGKALSPVGTSLSETWSALIGDRIAAWRLKNAASLQVAINAEVSDLGLKLDRSKIPERYAFAWFEEATKQDEPEIQMLFARLLARAASGDKDALDRRHLEILTCFTPMDATAMQWLFEHGGYPTVHPSMNEYRAWRGLRDELGEDSDVSLEHLVSLGVFERQFSLGQDVTLDRWETVDLGISLDKLVTELRDKLMIESELTATARGLSLFRACAPVLEDKTGAAA